MAIEEKIFLDCFSVTLDTKKLFIFSIDIVVIQSVFYVGCNVIKHKLPLFRFNISAIFCQKYIVKCSASAALPSTFYWIMNS